MSKLKAAFVQTRPVFGEIRKNVDSAVRKIMALGVSGLGVSGAGGLVVLPELFSTGYQFRSKEEALRYAEDPVKGYGPRRLAEAASGLGIHIVAGMAEKAGRRVFNSAVLISPAGVEAVYRKAHLFWGEKKIFTRGDTPFAVHDAGGYKVGMMICFDWLFPEAARALALKGAEVIAHPSNLVLPHCPQAMITRCLENRVYAVTANRVGTEERVSGTRLKFIGSSQVVSPLGEVLVRASRGRPGAGVVEIDPGAARNKNITPENDIFKDRREDLY